MENTKLYIALLAGAGCGVLSLSFFWHLVIRPRLGPEGVRAPRNWKEKLAASAAFVVLLIFVMLPRRLFNDDNYHWYLAFFWAFFGFPLLWSVVRVRGFSSRALTSRALAFIAFTFGIFSVVAVSMLFLSPWAAEGLFWAGLLSLMVILAWGLRSARVVGGAARKAFALCVFCLAVTFFTIAGIMWFKWKSSLALVAVSFAIADIAVGAIGLHWARRAS